MSAPDAAADASASRSRALIPEEGREPGRRLRGRVQNFAGVCNAPIGSQQRRCRDLQRSHQVSDPKRSGNTAYGGRPG